MHTKIKHDNTEVYICIYGIRVFWNNLKKGSSKKKSSAEKKLMFVSISF